MLNKKENLFKTELESKVKELVTNCVFNSFFNVDDSSEDVINDNVLDAEIEKLIMDNIDKDYIEIEEDVMCRLKESSTKTYNMDDELINDLNNEASLHSKEIVENIFNILNDIQNNKGYILLRPNKASYNCTLNDDLTNITNEYRISNNNSEDIAIIPSFDTLSLVNGNLQVQHIKVDNVTELLKNKENFYEANRTKGNLNDEFYVQFTVDDSVKLLFFPYIRIKQKNNIVKKIKISIECFCNSDQFM